MVLLFSLLALVLGAPTSSYRAEIERHRAAREAELKGDAGWLTVAGLFWLKEGVNVAGSAAGSDVLLPKKAPPRLGVFEMRGDQVSFTADAGVEVRSGTGRVERLEFGADEEKWLAAGDLRFVVIRRGDRVGVRMRDLRSAMRLAFKGLEYYPISPAYRIRGRFVPYKEPKRIAIPNVLGQNPEMISPGYVVFTLHGTRLRLDPVYETDEKADLFFIFKDPTSRDATYPAGRFLHAPLPAKGEVILDFNKAYNPPCAFTEFATCPLPPKQNQLPVRIEAGELAYHGPTRGS